jgi:GTP-binding protein
VLIADRNRSTLREQKYKRAVRAENGSDGSNRKKAGPAGGDSMVSLPVGTEVFDETDPEGKSLCDLLAHGEKFTVSRGGRGGLGNSRFTTPTRQAPDFATQGRTGETRELRLSLKLIADVALVGLPNAGKSTFLSAISSAQPRIAEYPFTTLVPALGVVTSDDHRFVVADIPGLIEGASHGAGLGDRFLRHIERTRVLVHLIDAGNAFLEERSIIEEFKTIRNEISSYDTNLAQRVQWIVLNKVDLVADRTQLNEVQNHLEGLGFHVVRTSGVTREGLDELIKNLSRSLLKRNA